MHTKLVLLSTLALMGMAATKAPAPVDKPLAEAAPDEPLRIATDYLNALEGTGPDYARTYLLGKVTLDAEVVAIANWKIVKREPEVVEKAKLADAVSELKKLDRLGSDYLKKKYKLKTAAEITREQAREVIAPTQAQAELFARKFPLFARAARVNTWVYWNANNPLRQLMPELGSRGEYQLWYHHFEVEEVLKQGKTRTWPLRVLRIKTDIYDSGWKILPASSWDPGV
ncbi:MAG: hypothetical protein ABIJ09_00995 [Pseudomonadota bacterium]